MVPPGLLKMPVPAEFDIVMVWPPELLMAPLLVMVPELLMVPLGLLLLREPLLVMVPELSMVPPLFNVPVEVISMVPVAALFRV